MNLQPALDSVPGRVVRKFMEDQAPNWATLIAWNALFALFPIVLFMAALLGFVLGIVGVSSKVVFNTVVAGIPDPNAQRDVLEALQGVKNQSGLLFAVGLLGLLWGGSALFGAIEHAFTAIYHTRPRDFIPQKLVAFGMMLLFTVLGGLAVGTSSLLPALKHIRGAPDFLDSGIVAFLLQVLLGMAAGLILFGSIYLIVPNRRQGLRRIWPGALLAGTLFELVSLLFPTYLSLNRGLNAYGKTFGLLFVLLTFFFLIGLITMLGAELNGVLYPEPAEPRRGGPRMMAALKGARDSATLAARSRARPDQADRRLRARTALGLALLASVVGVLLGRRSASSD